MPSKSVEARNLKKARFVEGVMMGMSDADALKYAGLPTKSSSQPNKIRSDPWVQAQLRAATSTITERARVTREKVEGIVLEAIDIARIKGDPDPMIRGASELSRMNGFYAPERRELSVEGELAIRELEAMSDKQLLELLGEEQTPIEAEFERLK